MNDEINAIAGIEGKVLNCFTKMILKGPKRGREEELQSRLHSAPSGPGQPSSHRNIMHSSLTFSNNSEQELKQKKPKKPKPSRVYILGDKSHKALSQQLVVKKR